MNDMDISKFVEEFYYEICPECQKKITVDIYRQRFKKHKKNNGLICSYSYNNIQGKTYKLKKTLEKIYKNT
jgi:hypothetical protein